MNFPMRLVLSWALVLALSLAVSLQGAAAVSVPCMAGTSGQTGASHASRTMSASMSMSTVIQPCSHAPGGPVVGATGDPHLASKAPTGVGKCGACCAGCVAGAPLAIRPEPARVDAFRAVAGTVAVMSPTFLTEGQDRPPRSIDA